MRFFKIKFSLFLFEFILSIIFELTFMKLLIVFGYTIIIIWHKAKLNENPRQTDNLKH